MGTFNIKIFSKSLNKEMNIAIFVPQGYENDRLPVLYFLHGRSGDERILSQIRLDGLASRMVEKNLIKPMIIVCPNMDNSRGINSFTECKKIEGKHGTVNLGLYEDYLIKDVIAFIDKNYNTCNSREYRYIGGISSGGYAALHNGLRHSDFFSKVGAHMPAVDLSYIDEDECYFKDIDMWNKYDPIALAEEKNLAGTSFYLDDGKEDEGEFYLACEKLYSILKNRGAKVVFHLFDGHHDVEYVVSNLDKYLKFYGGNL